MGVDRNPLLKPDWRYIEKPTLDDFDADDWAVMNAQRPHYQAELQATNALRFLTSQRDDPTFGYVVNNYMHCLQAATLAYRDGCDEDTVVVSLLHDIGFIACPDNHGAFAAALLGPFTSEANHWMLERHAIFQQHHIHDYPGLDSDERERWRGHPHFEWAATWVERYDQNSVWDGIDTMPIEAFEPMVHRFFAAPPRRLPID